MVVITERGIQNLAAKGKTLDELLEELKLPADASVILNGSKASDGRTTLKDSDRVMVARNVRGG